MTDSSDPQHSADPNRPPEAQQPPQPQQAQQAEQPPQYQQPQYQQQQYQQPQYQQPQQSDQQQQPQYQQPQQSDQQQQQYAQQPQYTQPQPAGPLTPEQDKSYAMWSHLGGAVSFLALFTGWLALLAIVPALVFYLAYGKRGERVRQEAKEALNFQITMVGAMIIWAIVAAILYAALFVPLLFGGGWFVLTLLLALVGWALVVIDVVFSIIAGMRVNAGGSYRYPFAVRFIK